MLVTNVLVESIEGSRMSEKASEDSPSNYNLNVSLTERDRNPSSLLLSFTLDLMNQPQLAKMSVRGVATLTGSREEVQSAIESPDGQSPPPVLVTIYERVYGLLYLTAGSLKIPHPMPNLLKTSETARK